MELSNINKDRKFRRKTGSLELGTMAFGKVPPQAKELEEAVLGQSCWRKMHLMLSWKF